MLLGLLRSLPLQCLRDESSLILGIESSIRAIGVIGAIRVITVAMFPEMRVH